jgi:hypothetical protein
VRPPLDDDVLVTVMLSVNEVVLVLSEESENEPDATVMTAMPPVDRDPEKVAVYDVPLPENPVSVPSVADTSDDVKLVVDSLTVKVTVVVEPDDTVAGLALRETVGAPVS